MLEVWGWKKADGGVGAGGRKGDGDGDGEIPWS